MICVTSLSLSLQPHSDFFFLFQQHKKRIPRPFLLSAPLFPALASPLVAGTLVAQGSRESWQALADASDVVAGSPAVHAEGTRLGTAMAVESWWAD